MGFIYCIQSPCGKMYIGQTRRSVELRIKEHFKCEGTCLILENAIKKYGSELMKVETLLEVNDAFLNTYEQMFIEKFQTVEPLGYNIRLGGSNGNHSELSRERMREAKLGQKNHNFGKPRTIEAKTAISLAKSGEKHHFFGKTFTDEHKIHLSLAHRKSFSELPMYVVYIKPRPKYYQNSGFAIMNHPKLRNKYFTSKQFSEEENLAQALAYIDST